ncbi:MAG: hypothetical protein U0903_08550 [Planctomycetales bacterium]
MMPKREEEICERLVTLRIQAGRPEDAVRALTEIRERIPAAKTLGGESIADWQARLTREGKIPAKEFAARRRSVSDLKVLKEGGPGEANPDQEIPIPAEAAPAWRRWQLQISPSEQRLIVRDSRTNQLEWSLPLRSRTEGNEEFTAHLEGDRLYVLFRGVLHALAPFERRVLWMRNLEGVSSIQEEYVRSENSGARMLVPFSKSVLSRRSVDEVWREPLQSLGAGVLAFRHRRSLELLDAQTGETLWTLEGLNPDIEFRGDGGYLYLFSMISQTPQVRSVRDGHVVEVPRLHEELKKTLQFTGHHLIRQDHAAGEGGEKIWALSSYDPVSREVIWERKYGNEEPLVACLSEGAILVKGEGDEMELVDLHSGGAKPLGKMELPSNSRRNPSLTAFRDWEQIYVAINRGGARTIFQDGLPVTEVNGMVLAFSATDGGLKWKKELRGGRNGWDREGGGYGAILERLNDSEVLLFSRREFERKNRQDDFGMWTQRLVAVDKETGREVLRTAIVPASGFRSMTVHPAEGIVELRGYDQRVRLVPKPAKSETPATEPAQKPPAKKPADAAPAKSSSP